MMGTWSLRWQASLATATTSSERRGGRDADAGGLPDVWLGRDSAMLLQLIVTVTLHY